MAARRVIISPLVLLSVVDHYKRLSSPRVIGVVLGTASKGTVEVTNSFAIPFEECENGFFIDTSYLLTMYELYHKVNSQEKIVGWYHSGPNLHKTDTDISKAMLKYCSEPVLVVVNVHQETNDIPCQVFELINKSELSYVNVQIGADETEEVGVEHLLRDIKENTGYTLKDKVGIIVSSLEAWRDALGNIIEYLEKVENGKKGDRGIMEMLQDILNDAPKCDSNVDLGMIYVTELADALMAMHDLKRETIKQE